MIQNTLKKYWKLVSTLLIAVLIFNPAQPTQSASIDPQTTPLLTAEDLAIFFESFIPPGMETFNLPGVVVAVLPDVACFGGGHTALLLGCTVRPG